MEDTAQVGKVFQALGALETILLKMVAQRIWFDQS